ncbi:DoxX family protein [Patescibacteria group bacterium]|nr:DoxX family protein [Patescibacteria group bacterium]
MKTTKTIFWITTIIIFLFEGVLPALTSHSEMSVNSFIHLGYPLYFISLLTVFKVLGSLALVIPQVSPRIKEWAYVGFGIDFIAALVSVWVVDGFGLMLLMPVAFMIILVISYRSYHKIRALQ